MKIGGAFLCQLMTLLVLSPDEADPSKTELGHILGFNTKTY
jgi:hypothetical protein